MPSSVRNALLFLFVALGACRTGNAQGHIRSRTAVADLTLSSPTSHPFPHGLHDVLRLLNSSLDQVGNLSETCKDNLRYTITSAADGESWALKMFDSMGKPASGIMESGLIFLGVYSECLEVIPPSYHVSSNTMHSAAWTRVREMFHGKYCMASVQFNKEAIDKIEENLGLTWAVLENSTSLPSFGICFPSSCTEESMKSLLNTAFSLVLPSTNVYVSCNVNEKSLKHDAGALIVLFILCMFVLLAICGTSFDIVNSYMEKHSGLLSVFERSQVTVNGSKDGLTATNADYGSQDNRISAISHGDPNSASIEVLCEPAEKKSSGGWKLMRDILLTFSMKTNGRKILQTSSASSGSIDSLNGIRVLSMWWIIIGHSYAFALQWLVFNSQTSVAFSSAASVLGQAISNGTFSVDTFFYLSGFLLAYVSMKQLMKTQGKLSLPLFYFHRFWRMTPLMMAIIAFCATLLHYVGEGPKWSEATVMYDSWCKKNWWTNAIYLQNFIHREEMCLSHSWYSSVDMQLYIVSPPILLALYWRPKIGYAVIGALIAISTIITAVLTAVNDYPAVPYNNNIVPLDLMNEYYGRVYIKPYCRIGPYLVGMALGYFAATKKGEVVCKKYYAALGWIAATACNLAILYGMFPASQGHLPSTASATIYGATTRTFWAFGIAWVTFACMYGYGGYVNTFLSWKAFVPFSRLTYCAYLIHPVVMAIFYGSRQTSFDFSNYFMIYMIIGNIVLTYFCSFLLSMLFESPFLGLEKILLGRK